MSVTEIRVAGINPTSPEGERGMNELYTALTIALVCAGIGFVGYVIGVVAQASEFDISNVGSEE